MKIYRYKRYSISLDQSSHERCRVLADERATSISGLLRILIMDAYEKRKLAVEAA
jgi:hypothetical protein